MKFDIYQAVTDRIINELEKGNIPWKKPWKSIGVKLKGGIADMKKIAFNRVSKQAYSALNQMLLSKAGEYASFKQWSDLGGTIRKGAKAEMVVFWKLLPIEEKDEKTQEVTIKRIPILKYYNVFHIDDVEGVKPLETNEADVLASGNEIETIESAEEIVHTYVERENIGLYFGGNSAYYVPVLDQIHIPEKKQFENVAEYYSTIFHEMTHSTGSAKRLNRLSGTAYFGNADYSKEELVAEIGASGLLSMLGIETPSSFQNNTAYIKNWLEALRNDKKLIVSASSKAEKAIEYILNGKPNDNEIEEVA